MANWKVAPSYQSAKILKVDEDVRKAYIEETCDRCGGHGIIASRVENGHIVPIPVDGGVCYKCGGAGVIRKWVKAYTEEELEKYVAAQKRTREKKIQAEELRRQDLINKSEENKKSLLSQLGYDAEDPKVYIVVGENTYAIKDELKAAGARFDRALGWYFQHEEEVPEGYQLVTINFDQVFEWKPMIKKIFIKDNAKEIAEAAVMSVMPESHSEYIGEIKERKRDMKVTLTASRSFDGYYGTTFIYTFDYNENVLVWMTSSCQDIEVGEEVFLTGTVKSHDEYKGVKQTKLSRCIIKKER